MKKTWDVPVLEILDVRKTLSGKGHEIPDAVQPDDDDTIFHTPS
ncbi:paeninodin family lasso peptide [Paenibacillus protaetiae]|uniref:Paeninodin family lasso peptide n=1 Tax=Paenibacillus protaetiae TaxID=2509456 RepID=A0A4P6EUW6_9BACL|nr:paeninodin family lasso peptide [Paenibacillus protaetiae]QAY66782.1 paeninodin family lasso peptide [Paenibacillus protaetiae]